MLSGRHSPRRKADTGRPVRLWSEQSGGAFRSPSQPAPRPPAGPDCGRSPPPWPSRPAHRSRPARPVGAAAPGCGPSSPAASSPGIRCRGPAGWDIVWRSYVRSCCPPPRRSVFSSSCTSGVVTYHQFSGAPKSRMMSAPSKSAICFPIAVPISASSAFARRMKNV